MEHETLAEANARSQARYEWLLRRDKIDKIGFTILAGVIVLLWWYK